MKHANHVKATVRRLIVAFWRAQSGLECLPPDRTYVTLCDEEASFFAQCEVEQLLHMEPKIITPAQYIGVNNDPTSSNGTWEGIPPCGSSVLISRTHMNILFRISLSLSLDK